ncbi:MAG: hypothetical protein H0T87_03440 [Gammaproteobacteria bacterium]|nr:hypothetical protein [Gammaproteobacteria bacterium]
MDIIIALGIFGALLFWVFIITNKPADPTLIENQTKATRGSGAPLPEQRAGDRQQPESKPAPMKVGGDVAAPLEATGHAAGRGRPMPEVLAEIRKANAAAMSPFGLPARGLAPQPAGPVTPAEPDRKSVPRQKRRTPSPIQREFYHYFDLKAPNGLSFDEALSVIHDFKDRLSKDDQGKLDEWDTYVKLYSEINKPGVRKTYRIKKVSFSAYRAAIKQLKKEGQVWAGEKDSRDLVVKKIIAMAPRLKTEAA